MGLRVTALIFLSTYTLSCADYRPAPLRPAEAAHQFAERTLGGPDLCSYLRANLTAALPKCPPTRWDLASLTLAGFFYSPDLEWSQEHNSTSREWQLLRPVSGRIQPSV